MTGAETVRFKLDVNGQDGRFLLPTMLLSETER